MNPCEDVRGVAGAQIGAGRFAMAGKQRRVRPPGGRHGRQQRTTISTGSPVSWMVVKTLSPFPAVESPAVMALHSPVFPCLKLRRICGRRAPTPVADEMICTGVQADGGSPQSASAQTTRNKRTARERRKEDYQHKRRRTVARQPAASTNAERACIFCAHPQQAPARPNGPGSEESGGRAENCRAYISHCYQVFLG